MQRGVPPFVRGGSALTPTEEAFRELRRRIEVEVPPTGTCAIWKGHWILGYFDPDGAAHEVMLERPGRWDADRLERADRTTVTLG